MITLLFLGTLHQSHSVQPIVASNFLKYLRHFFLTKIVRHQEVVLARLRVGHTLLTHGHLMAHSDPPRCLSCHARFSVLYILVDCPMFASFRRPLLPPSYLPSL